MWVYTRLHIQHARNARHMLMAIPRLYMYDELDNARVFTWKTWGVSWR